MKQTNFKQKRKQSIFKTALLLIVLFVFTLAGQAQVAVGLGEEPISGSLLQLKNKGNVTDGTANADKGLALPRVMLSEKKQLYPMFLANPDNSSSGPNSDYMANKADLDNAHTGLIVYNLVEDDEKELCLGLNQWDGVQWNCFQQKMGNAIATLGNCDSLKFMGLYQNDISLGAGNYMTIPLHVTKAGAYTINAIADPDNGYFFTFTGVFLTTGYYFLSIPGTGTPINHTEGQPHGDLMKVTFNGKQMDACDPMYIDVKDSSKKPLYTMSCGSTVVRGVYKLNTELIELPAANANYIEVTLNVDPAAYGATYVIETNTVDGIYFKGSGLLSSSTQTVRLQGYGKPNSLDDKIMTITSNSISPTAETCKNARVIIVIPKKKILGMGYYGATYGYFVNTSASLAVMQKDQNFGALESSTVKSDGFEFSYLSGASDIPSYIPKASRLDAELSKNPDIIVMGHAVNFDDYTTQKLTEYLYKGGVVIMFNEYYPSVERAAVTFFRSVFADESIDGANRNSRGRSYRLSSLDDEILNGPFGDARGKVWGEDASATLAITGLPVGNIDVYSNATCLGGSTYSGVTMFKHKTLNLFWVGDGGFTSNHNTFIGNYSDKGICPFAIDANHKPVPRTNWGEGSYTNQSAYNSIIFANVMAWAIKQAQFHGINTN